VILGGEEYDSVVQKIQGSYIMQVSAWVIAASLLFALIAGLFLFSLLTSRIRQLATAVDAFKRGDPLDRIDFPLTKQDNQAGDEIDQLGSTFEQMAKRIESQMEALKKSDTLRRELVANVSHDLRTPLATLQGYIDTLLLKDNHLTADERQNYLQVAARHCERLGKLIAELFELARLDSHETKVQCEPFSLSELLQDVVQKFRLTAQKRQIKVMTNIGRALPFVSADIRLVERVLENLIENALRYTPEGGSIHLELTLDQQDITVQVRDTGCGIPHEELPHIFDRFYQLDQSQEGKSGYSGLGLAIAKRILTLHNKSIEVSSSLNAGTTFTFRLPVYITPA